jgi:hypothetical protein
MSRTPMNPDDVRATLPLVVALLAAWSTNVPTPDADESGDEKSTANVDAVHQELAIHLVTSLRRYLFDGTSPLDAAKELPAAGEPGNFERAALALTGAKPTPIVHEWPDESKKVIAPAAETLTDLEVEDDEEAKAHAQPSDALKALLSLPGMRQCRCFRCGCLLQAHTREPGTWSCKTCKVRGATIAEKAPAPGK